MAAIAMLGGNARAQATYEVQPRAPEFLYARTCGYCHGHNVAPIIRGRNLPAPVIAAMVRSGQGAMPAFKPTEITNAELQALAQWLSTAPADPREHGQ
ncbi:cytochrome c [Altererythrobacter buctensis]|uniref:Cytochrome c n=2 Tax=Alteraurantiacibacter buctensis TaxID=1503981 RepID=A0A844YWL8_9SPHN|nr:cytochrome c [Alteraurantiacibacter buctensis]